MSLALRRLAGPDLLEALDVIAALRIAVFRDWPYLYDGDLDYERAYLAVYADKPDAIILGAFDGPTLVGAATGTPLEDHADSFAAAFKDSGLALDAVFYCAESVLLPAYRGQGMGHAFFDAREAQARALGRSFVAFCAVDRPADHPLRPENARSLAPFWQGRGYAPLPGVVAQFGWKDIDQPAQTDKALQFWIKRL